MDTSGDNQMGCRRNVQRSGHMSIHCSECRQRDVHCSVQSCYRSGQFSEESSDGLSEGCSEKCA